MSDVYALPIAERQVINESLYLEPLKRTVKLLLAVKEDEPVLLRYISEQFSVHEPIDAATGISATDLAKRYEPAFKNSLKDSLTIVAADCFEVCGVITSNKILKGPKRTEPLKKDYSNEIAASKAHCLSAKQIEVFVDELESFTPNFLPADCENFYQIDFFSVLPEYRGSGLAKRLWLEGLRLAHSRGFKFVQSGCSAKASTQIALKHGMNIVFSFPYADFCANGQPILGTKLKDGSTQANLLVGELDKILPKFENKRNITKNYTLPPIERELVEEYSKNDANIRIEVIKPEDEAVITHFLVQEFEKQGPMLRTLQTNRRDHEELKKYFGSEGSGCVGNGYSLVASENNLVYGLLYARPVKISGGIEIETDEEVFAQLDSKKNMCLALALLTTFLKWLDKQVALKLPPNKEHDVFYIDVLSVHPECRGLNIGKALWNECMKRAHAQGYKYSYAICTASASTKIALAAGMDTIFSYPFNKIKYQGQTLFPKGRTYDGCEKVSVMFANLDKLYGDK